MRWRTGEKGATREKRRRRNSIVSKSTIRKNGKNKKSNNTNKTKQQPVKIKKELAEKRKTLAIHVEQLQDGTVEKMIKKHLDSCNDTSHFHHYYYYCHYHPTNALEETIAYYKQIVVKQIIEPLQEDVTQLERTS
ncbi:MAG: hypothetical protein M3270_00115 [Thermoproteota archaeon]|nr:hypothetical protein [Thermoproteota archaeon]